MPFLRIINIILNLCETFKSEISTLDLSKKAEKWSKVNFCTWIFQRLYDSCYHTILGNGKINTWHFSSLIFNTKKESTRTLEIWFHTRSQWKEMHVNQFCSEVFIFLPILFESVYWLHNSQAHYIGIHFIGAKRQKTSSHGLIFHISFIHAKVFFISSTLFLSV